MQPIPLPVGSYRLPNPTASCRRLLNCFAEPAPPDAPKGQPLLLRRAPGVSAFAEVAEALGGRGGFIMRDELYVVIDAALYHVSAVGTLTQIGAGIITGNGPVRAETNGIEAVILNPETGAGFRTDGVTLAVYADAVFVGFGGAGDVAFLDGYLIFRRRNTQQFFNTGLLTLVCNALDITSADGAPDNLTTLIANNRELILPGTQTTERWYNAANSTGSPFSRSPQGFHPLGTTAQFSLSNQDNAPYMLAVDLTFRRLESQWARVSQFAIEGILQRMAVTSDCLALPYTQEGHLFISFTFANAGRTLVYDVSTNEWHERDSIIDTVPLSRWRVSAIFQCYGKQIVLDSTSGKVGILDPDVHTEWGEPQRLEFTFQPVYARRNRLFHRRFELHVGAGVGTATGQGENPLATLFVSDDDGQTWRSRDVRSLGAMGKYQARLNWWGLGSARDRVYRIAMSDPVQSFTVDALLHADEGTS